MCPTAHVFTLTPICPHTLSNRSVIVSLDSTIQVRVLSEKPETHPQRRRPERKRPQRGDVITVRSADIDPPDALEGTSFFDTLRRKLQWSGSNVAPVDQTSLSAEAC